MAYNYKIAILTTSQGFPWRIEDFCFSGYDNLDEKIRLMAKDLNYYRTLKDGYGNNVYDGVRLSVTELKPNVKENLVLRVYHNLITRIVITNKFINFKIEVDEEL